MLNLNSKRSKRNRKEWQKLVDAFAASPLDLQTFCEEQSIKPDRLKFWRRQFKKSKFVELPAIVQQAAAERDPGM